MAVTREQVLAALGRVPYPGFTRDIVASGVVDALEISGDRVRLRLVTRGGDPRVLQQIRKDAEAALGDVPGVAAVEFVGTTATPTPPSLGMVGRKPQSAASAGGVDASLLPEVRHTVAIASGKGGVGKSTVAVNLAVALAKSGLRVGLLDADVYGPSIPVMFGLVGQRPRMEASGNRLIPFERYGVRFMSIGFLVEPDAPVIWRGPMLMKGLDHLLRDVAWGALDVLLVDMPPGTGDVQLTLAQKVQLAGAIIVSTPQDVALADAVKGAAMFDRVQVPVLGLVENMSFFVCPHCDERSEIFAHGGARAEAERLGVPFLGEIPLEPAIRKGGDTGHPAADGDGPQAESFRRLAATVQAALVAEASAPDDAPGPGVIGRFRRIFE